MPYLTRSLNTGQPVNWACPLNNGLVSWWMVHPATMRGSILFRDLCNRYHGTLTNMDPATDWVGSRGRPGGFGALDFDGSDDYATCGNVPVGGLTEITISAWVFARSAGQSNGGRIVSKNDETPVGLRFNGAVTSVVFGINATTLAATVDSLANQWQHLAGVFSSGVTNGKAVYQNANSKGTATQTATLTANANAVLIGNRESVTRTFDGLIDDVRIWNRALSASEIAALYQDSLLGYPQSLNWIRPRVMVQGAAPPGGLSIPIAAYHYNHHLGSMAG